MATAQLSGRRLQPSVIEYYATPEIRHAIREYCGQTDSSRSGAVYVAGLVPDDRRFPTWLTHAVRVAASGMDSLLEQGSDVARSLWDRSNLIFLLELDYENVDRPAEPFLRPAEVFFDLEPSYRAVRRVLRHLGIQPYVVMTGRGYQFTGRIPLDDAVVSRLAALVAELPAWQPGVQARHETLAATLAPDHARAAAGLGLLIEHCAHLVMRAAARVSSIPVVFNGTIVGDGVRGRECVSIDFSHVGDPLDMRHARAAFSAYQWHLMRPDVFGSLSGRVAPIAALPRAGESLLSLLAHQRTLAEGERRARRARTSLPDVSGGIVRLLDAYLASPLARFHRDFYGRRTTAAGGDPGGVPPCIRASLNQPNDRLLKPEHIQHAVRGLMARGWHPAAIAALLQSKYEEDHGWGDRWSWMDRQTRAEFDVRVFAGMIHAGLDTLVDFNCVSAQEKDLCPRTGCAYDLRRDRDRLMAADPS